jgi:hypothetical protein
MKDLTPPRRVIRSIATRIITVFTFCVISVTAVAEDEVDIGCSSANMLKLAAPFEEAIVLRRSPFPGITGYATGEVGVHSAQIEEPTNDFFLLSGSADLRLILVAKDPGIEVWNDHGSAYMEIGETFYVGQPAFDTHPVWNIVSGVPGQNYTITMRIHDVSGTYTDSEPFEITFTPVAPPSVSIALTNSNEASVTVSGSHGTEYILQAANSNAPAAAWQSVATNTTDSEGIWTHIESVNGQTQRFFRAVLP